MRKKLNACYAIALLIIASCSKESLKVPQSNNKQTNEKAADQIAGHYVGEFFGGGIIFFIGINGKHGLIADTSDLNKASWEDEFYIYADATRTDIRAGKQNTMRIVAVYGSHGLYAARECALSKRKGYTDWFLPSKDELNELYKQKNLVPGVANNVYWSSSEKNTSGAWWQYFVDGSQDTELKDAVYSVRAVRAF